MELAANWFAIRGWGSAAEGPDDRLHTGCSTGALLPHAPTARQRGIPPSPTCERRTYAFTGSAKKASMVLGDVLRTPPLGQDERMAQQRPFCLATLLATLQESDRDARPGAGLGEGRIGQGGDIAQSWAEPRGRGARGELLHGLWDARGWMSAVPSCTGSRTGMDRAQLDQFRVRPARFAIGQQGPLAPCCSSTPLSKLTLPSCSASDSEQFWALTGYDPPVSSKE